MMLPFFLIVFGGLYYMHGHYMGRQQALLRARSCTWTYAAGGCQDRKTLDACLTDRAGNTPDAPQQANEETDSPPVNGDDVGDGSGPGFLKKLANAPVIGGAITWLFGKPVSVRAKEPVHLRHNPTAGPSEFVVRGSYFTMCNTVPKPWAGVAHEVFCGFVGDDFPSCPPGS